MDSICGITVTELAPSEWLNIVSIAVSAIGIVVSSMVAIWIVDTLQKRLETRHQLKDHFAKEVLSIREQYRKIVEDLIGKEQKPKQIMCSFKIAGIYANGLLTIMNNQFNTPTDILRPFQTELMSIVSDSDEFNMAYRRNRRFRFRNETIASIQDFAKRHENLFNDLLMTIYNEPR